MEIIYKSTLIKNKIFLFGLKGFSTYENQISLEEVKNKKIFLAIDKNIFNTDLKGLEKVLSQIDQYNILGILFYDLAVLSLSKKLNIKTPLIWSQDYLVTNYKTCNYYKNEGCSGAVIAPLITIDEIEEIAKNTDMDLFVPIFGYQEMALSKRYLVSNYFEYIGEENDKDINYMIEKESVYPIKEDKYGTKIYTKDILSGIRYINRLKKMGIKYIVLDDFLIDEDKFKKISSLYERAVYEQLSDDDLLNLEKEIDSIAHSTSLLFFNKKTVYKVKK